MSRKIEMRHIEDITRLDSGAVAIHFKDARAPIALRDPEKASEIIQKLKAYRRTQLDPSDRIIHGIDAVDEYGIWDRDKEQEAIKSTLSLRESKKWRDLDENSIAFLSKVVEVKDYSEAIVEGLKLKLEGLVKIIQSSEEILARPQIDEHEIESLKNMLKIIKEMSGASSRFGRATLTILDKWIQDYSPKEEVDDASDSRSL